MGKGIDAIPAKLVIKPLPAWKRSEDSIVYLGQVSSLGQASRETRKYSISCKAVEECGIS